MKKIIFLVLILILSTACSQKNIEESQKETNNKIEIIDKESEISDIEIDVKIKSYATFDIIFKNKSNNEYLTGKGWDFFYRKNDKSEWKNITPSGYEVTNEGIMITKDKDFEQELSMVDIFDKKKFDLGEYKIVKNVQNNKGVENQVYYMFIIK